MKKVKLKALMYLSRGVERDEMFEADAQEARDLTTCNPPRAVLVSVGAKPAAKGKSE